jgi:hypothetical protein
LNFDFELVVGSVSRLCHTRFQLTAFSRLKIGRVNPALTFSHSLGSYLHNGENRIKLVGFREQEKYGLFEKPAYFHYSVNEPLTSLLLPPEPIL